MMQCHRLAIPAVESERPTSTSFLNSPCLLRRTYRRSPACGSSTVRLLVFDHVFLVAILLNRTIARQAMPLFPPRATQFENTLADPIR